MARVPRKAMTDTRQGRNFDKTQFRGDFEEEVCDKEG